MRIRWLDGVIELDVFELGAPDDALLLGGRSAHSMPSCRGCTSARARNSPRRNRVLLADQHRVAASPPHPGSRSRRRTRARRVVVEPEPVHLVDDPDCTCHRVQDLRPPSSKQESMDSARMWNSRSPGVAGAWCREPSSSTNGCSLAGRDPANNRSHAFEPIPVTSVRCAAGVRNPTARTSPDRFSNPASCTFCSPPSLIVATRKIAAGVNGAIIGCGVVRAPYDPSVIPARHAAMMVNMSASAQGLCEFIDASPSPFHVCATAAQRLRVAGFGELSEARRVAGRSAGRLLHGAGRLAGGLGSGDADEPPCRSGSSAATPTAPTCGSSSTPTGSSRAGRWSRCSPTAGRG